MKDFERTDYTEVRKMIQTGEGFVVGSHNYGRLDRKSDDELDAVAKNAGQIAHQVAQLLDAIDIVTFARSNEQSAKENV